MTPERRAELLDELDAIDGSLAGRRSALAEVILRMKRALLLEELDEADPEPDSGPTLGLEARGAR